MAKILLGIFHITPVAPVPTEIWNIHNTISDEIISNKDSKSPETHSCQEWFKIFGEDDLIQYTMRSGKREIKTSMKGPIEVDQPAGHAEIIPFQEFSISLVPDQLVYWTILLN